MIIGDDITALERCLISVREYIDYWVIVDIGESAETEELVAHSLRRVPGEFHRLPFIDFSTSRNQAMALARESGRTDYLLLIDDHHIFEVGDPDFKNTLSADGYFIQSGGSEEVFHLRIVNSALEWQYYGYAEEILLSQPTYSTLPHERLRLGHTLNPLQTARRTAAARQLLSRQLQDIPEDSHAIFNMANLLYRSGDLAGALPWFDRYLESENKWDPEWVWYALYSKAQILEATDHPLQTLIDAYQRCYASRPIRVEPLFQITRLYRLNSELALAELFGAKAMALDIPAELFNLERLIYTWSLPVEYALVCFRLGLYEKSIEAANKALSNRSVARNARDSLINSRQRSVEAIYTNRAVEQPLNNKNSIRVVVPFRNAAPYLAGCIESLASQDYENFRVTFIDDCSDDSGASLIPQDDSRFEIVTNGVQQGALRNRLNCILSCAPEEIVLYLDGDDQLASDSALSYVNSIYNQYDCWMTYGQYITQRGNTGWAMPYASPRHFEQVLTNGGMTFPVHAITHRAGLMQRLAEFDPALNAFKDDRGDWLVYASDAVLARPLFFMAGWERTIYINRVIYLYTEGHETSEYMSHSEEQKNTCAIINRKLRPPRLESYLAD